MNWRSNPGVVAPFLVAMLAAISLPVAHAAVGSKIDPQKPAAPIQERKLHNPLIENAKNADDTSRDVVAGVIDYDVPKLEAAIAKLEKRAGTTDSKPDDDYFLAQGRVGLLQIKRFYETDEKDKMPPSLEKIDLDSFADATLEIAQRYAQAHPDHSDIQRVIGEIYSAKIRGMTGGMTQGPKAKAAIEAALAKDPQNGLALLCQGRMHYHNPSFAGGDKNLALVEFRKVAQDIDDIRAHLYMARIYRDREMYSQARFFAKKALRVAPENPEGKLLLSNAEAAEAKQKSEKGGSR